MNKENKIFKKVLQQSLLKMQGKMDIMKNRFENASTIESACEEMNAIISGLLFVLENYDDN